MRILLLEDEVMLREAIKEYLESWGEIVTSVGDGAACQEVMRRESFDLYLFDINVPIVDGFDLLAELKEQRCQAPVIFITAMTEIEEITRAYELGCAEYIKKPFKLPELKLRIDHLFKLLGQANVSRVRLGARTLFDRRERELYIDSELVPLTRRHRDILALLVSRIGHVVSLHQFRLEVWGRDDIDDATIRAEINRLRKLLVEDVIHNIKGIGYKIERY